MCERIWKVSANPQEQHQRPVFGAANHHVEVRFGAVVIFLWLIISLWPNPFVVGDCAGSALVTMDWFPPGRTIANQEPGGSMSPKYPLPPRAPPPVENDATALFGRAGSPQADSHRPSTQWPVRSCLRYMRSAFRAT